MTPSRNDTVTIPCPVCATSFNPVGKRRFCSDRCRVANHRRRRRPEPDTATTVTSPAPTRPQATIVYECETCDLRQLGNQRCECGLFMRRVGPGGHCPDCDQIITIQELLDQ